MTKHSINLVLTLTKFYVHRYFFCSANFIQILIRLIKFSVFVNISVDTSHQFFHFFNSATYFTRFILPRRVRYPLLVNDSLQKEISLVCIEPRRSAKLHASNVLVFRLLVSISAGSFVTNRFTAAPLSLTRHNTAVPYVSSIHAR